MVRKCDHCGDFAIEDDEQVCQSCGIVVEGIQLVSQHGKPNSGVCYAVNNIGASIMKSVKPPAGLTFGLGSLKRLCHELRIPTKVTDDASNLFRGAYKDRIFRSKWDIPILAGCCIFLIQKKEKNRVSINTICNLLSCQKRKFSSLLNYLKSWMARNRSAEKCCGDVGILSPSKQRGTLEALNGSLPEHAATLIEEVCGKIVDEEKDALIEKTLGLVKLSYSCWLYTGRSPRSVVVACAFLCWKSMNRARRKAAFQTFCSKFGIREPMAPKRIIELKALLLKLGRNIPSPCKDYVTKKNILFHLTTILENSETLRNDLLLPGEFGEEVVNCKEYSSFRIPPRQRPRQQETILPAEESLANKADAEISETEIDSYIRTDSEVAIIKKLIKS